MAGSMVSLIVIIAVIIPTSSAHLSLNGGLKPLGRLRRTSVSFQRRFLRAWAERKRNCLDRVGIIGCGPAGLSMAHALKKLDTGVGRVDVFDKGEALKSGLGGGIQLNGGAAVLARMGLGDKIQEYGLPVKGIRTRTVSEKELLYLNVSALARNEPSLMHNGEPMVFTIMRDSLQQLLADELPNGCQIHFNKRVVDVLDDEANGKVTCIFADGSSEKFDLLIGADGIRSQVKQKSISANEDDTPKYSNIRIQFGIAPGWERPDGKGKYTQELHQWFGEGTYALTGQYLGVENQKFEMVALVFADDEDEGENPDWIQGDEVKENCIQRLEAAGNPDEVISLAKRANRYFEVGVYYYPSLMPWTSETKQVVLIGDAAHAMPPFLGQGANQAIQDAFCLASKLSDIKSGRISSISDAVDAYEFQRKIPTTAIQLESRILGVLETAGGSTSGTLPSFVRDAFFGLTGKLGIAEKVFITGATPQV